MEELVAAGGDDCVTDQISTIWSGEARIGPAAWLASATYQLWRIVDRRDAAHPPALEKIAAEVGATPVQVALSWTLRQDGLIAIPKASSVAHVRENRGPPISFFRRSACDTRRGISQATRPPSTRDALASDDNIVARRNKAQTGSAVEAEFKLVEPATGG